MADISKEIGLSQKLRGAEFQFWLFFYVLWGIDFVESIAEYIIMPLHPPLWKPFKKHGGHFQSNTSISETKSRRAFNFDSVSRFCGAYTYRKSIVSYVSVLGINHVDVCGGHFTKWRAFLWIILFISQLRGMWPQFWFTLVYFKVAELRKNYCDLHKVGMHTMLVVFVWKSKTFPWVLSYCSETFRCRRFIKVPICVHV